MYTTIPSSISVLIVCFLYQHFLVSMRKLVLFFFLMKLLKLIVPARRVIASPVIGVVPRLVPARVAFAALLIPSELSSGWIGNLDALEGPVSMSEPWSMAGRRHYEILGPGTLFDL